MIKNDYIRELQIPHTQKRRGPNNNANDVRKIQSWLSLYEFNKPGAGTATAIDGDFGPATELAVKNYQRSIGVSTSGVVTRDLFEQMSYPMALAFDPSTDDGNLRDHIISYATYHLVMRPKELLINDESNSGPWVRGYMDGRDGQKLYWCMGFVQTIIDQAVSKAGGLYTDYLTKTNWCDLLGSDARQSGMLITNAQFKNNHTRVKKGDIFLLRSSKLRKEWGHTGIIIDVTPDIIQTIEGNTNMHGSRNGDGVYHRIRNYRLSKIDVVSIESMVGIYS